MDLVNQVVLLDGGIFLAVGRQLNAGAHGAVYRGVQYINGKPPRHCAVKMITGQARAAQGEVAVARSNAALDPHMCAAIHGTYHLPAHDIHLLLSDLMELSLAQMMQTCAFDARTCFNHIVRGLAALHAAGFMHRDLKPDNVMMRGGVMRLIDFSISRLVPVDNEGAGIGSPGMCCAIWYRAPEAALGAAYGFPADRWALALLGIECVTRVPLFQCHCDAHLMLAVEKAFNVRRLRPELLGKITTPSFAPRFVEATHTPGERACLHAACDFFHLNPANRRDLSVHLDDCPLGANVHATHQIDRGKKRSATGDPPRPGWMRPATTFF
jgi:serine/threonine protein kinase